MINNIAIRYKIFTIVEAAACCLDIPLDFSPILVYDATFAHPDNPEFEAITRMINMAIRRDELGIVSKNGTYLKSGYHDADDWHLLGGDLIDWLKKFHPELKPAFLFPEHANDEQASESARLRARIEELEGQLKEATDNKGASTKTINTQNGVIAAMALYIQGNKPQGFSEGKSLRAGAEQIIDKINGVASQYNIKKSVICPSTLESYIKAGLEKIKE